MRTLQGSEGTALSYATESQPDELVIKTHPRVGVILKGSPQGSEEDWDLNDGKWHFLWIERDSTGLTIREGDNTVSLTSIQTSLEGGGYLVLGQRQQSQKKFIEAKAFVGEISHLNIWNERRTRKDFEVIRKDCIGLNIGNIFHLSDGTIDSHQSASIIAADMCSNKALHFPNKGVTDVVTISNMRSVTDFTICLWMNSADSQGTPLSYAVSSEANELLIFYNGYFQLYIGGTQRQTSVSVHNGVWQHFCVTWQSSSGTLKLYKNGDKKDEFPSFKTGYKIKQGGTLALGQKQVSVGGGFEASKSFKGMLSNVNVWNQVLTDTQLKEMSKSCLLDEWNAGNLYKWRNFLREAKATLVEPSSCKTLGTDNAFHFPNKGVSDVVKLAGMPSLTAFTVCLWMSSTSNEGSPFSYAVRDKDNELLIYYTNQKFQLLIGGDTSDISVSANNGLWHHICVTWGKNQGLYKFYKDGELKQQGTLKRDHTIRPGGTLVLGQEQDSDGGDFSADQSFQGKLSNVNVWNNVLTDEQIETMSKSCLADVAGNDKVFKWLDFLHEGGATLVKPSPCEPMGMAHQLHFPNKGVNDFVKISGMRSSLTDFTVCLWMSSSNTEGSLISYAVSDSYNELLLYYNRRHFSLYIGGDSRQTSVTANDGVWHHICVSWQSSSGSWKLYKDGGLAGPNTASFKRGYTIRRGGAMVLGQDQDSVGGGFATDDSFQGMLANVNVWNKVLTPDQIETMSKSCLVGEENAGKVFKWLDFLREGVPRLVKPFSCEPFSKDYAFSFPDKGVNDFVKVSGMPILTEFTMCLWMSSSERRGSPFSYAVPDEDNELLLYYDKYFRLYIGGVESQTAVTANDGVWHHICVSWKSSTGLWKLYKDCDLKHDGGEELKKGYTIRASGTLVLGQDQDEVGGGFTTADSFQGMLSNVNVWDRVLPTSQIKEMSQSCQLDESNEGNVFKWPDFLRQGGTTLVKPSPCEPFAIMSYTFHFPNEGVDDVVKSPRMPSFTDFTVCLWMSSSDIHGSLLSYAVSDQANELLIYYDRCLELYIDGAKRTTSITTSDGVWHHICSSWAKNSGSWKIYKDGLLEHEGKNFKTGHTIRSGGTLVLGQEQDSVGGGFQASQSFQGMLSNVNMWSHVLTETQIKEMSKSCQLDEWNDGNVRRWSEFLSEGGAKLVQPSPCKPVEMGCRDALGMESRAITDVQISASSQWNANHAAIQGRLHFKKSGSKQGGWSAGSNNANQWLQIDLGNAYTRVTVVATQGRNSDTYNEWVTKYKLQYSNDGTNFHYYRERGQATDKELAGNADQDTIVYHVLTPQVMARYFRFRPLFWHDHISMRVELYGCSDCYGALGMENGLIVNGKISASSQWNGNYAAIQGRLHFKKSGSKAGAWSAGSNNVNQWLQVDLDSQQTRVTGVATQGRNAYNQWVTKYKLEYSNDGTNFQYYRQQGQTTDKI
ncbi:uncharacterized protein LOC144643983 [Oculina patagonica]